MTSPKGTSSSTSSQVQTCYKGHRHLPTPWTIYVIDPAVSFKTEKYNESMYPLESFDTEDEVKKLYKLSPFAEPNGPPSWSMVIPGGAIAVFRGGKYGVPAVTPKWEDPAAQNGGEYRFVFSREQEPLALVDELFGDLVSWMVSNSCYEGTQLLGLFIKNATWLNHPDVAPLRHEIQFRIWVSKIPLKEMPRLGRLIGNDIAKVLDQSGAKGTLTYRNFQSLMKKAGFDQETKKEYDNVLKFFIPPRRSIENSSRVPVYNDVRENRPNNVREARGEVQEEKRYNRSDRQVGGGGDADDSGTLTSRFSNTNRCGVNEERSGRREEKGDGDFKENSDSSGDGVVPRGRSGQRGGSDPFGRS